MNALQEGAFNNAVHSIRLNWVQDANLIWNNFSRSTNTGCSPSPSPLTANSCVDVNVTANATQVHIRPNNFSGGDTLAHAIYNQAAATAVQMEVSGDTTSTANLYRNTDGNLWIRGGGSSIYGEGAGTVNYIYEPNSGSQGLAVSNVPSAAPTAGSFVSVAQLAATEKAAPSATSAFDVCYGDSTLHALKCSYNNGSFFQVPQVITATSAAFATATTAGTCVQNTTAVTGAATSMAVSVSPVSTPGVGATWSGFVSSAGNVTITECATATSAGGSIAFNIRVTP
jgi:hypothetical protein